MSAVKVGPMVNVDVLPCNGAAWVEHHKLLGTILVCSACGTSQEEHPVVETSGAAQPPAEKPPVAVAEAAPVNPQLCPETGAACTQAPPCELPGSTGRTYCVRWVQKIQREEIARREHASNR